MSCCGGETIQQAMSEMGLPSASTAVHAHALLILPGLWRWQPIEPTKQSRLQSVLDSWMGTPYAAGRRDKKEGVGCRDLVSAVLDEMDRKEQPTNLIPMTEDAGINQLTLAQQAVEDMMQKHGLVRVEDHTIEPGDVVICHSRGDQSTHTVHAYIAGVRPGSVYHAPFPGSKVIWSALRTQPNIRGVGRPSKEAW